MSKNIIQGLGHVFYPESCPLENIIDLILPKYNCCVSPIHDRDIKEDGTIKKSHYHLLFVGKLTDKDKRYISKITTMNYFEPLYDINASYLYLFHWSSKTNWFIPGKAHYWSADIRKGELFDLHIDIKDNTISSDDYLTLLFNVLGNYNCFRDFFTGISNGQYPLEFVNFCVSKNSFINNWYRNCGFNSSPVSDAERYKSSVNRAKDDFYTTDYKRHQYSVECDENEFLISSFCPVDN